MYTFLSSSSLLFLSVHYAWASSSGAAAGVIGAFVAGIILVFVLMMPTILIIKKTASEIEEKTNQLEVKNIKKNNYVFIVLNFITVTLNWKFIYNNNFGILDLLCIILFILALMQIYFVFKLNEKIKNS